MGILHSVYHSHGSKVREIPLANEFDPIRDRLFSIPFYIFTPDRIVTRLNIYLFVIGQTYEYIRSRIIIDRSSNDGSR